MSEIKIIFVGIAVFYLFYFLAINLFYFFLNIVSFFAVRRRIQWKIIKSMPQIYSGFEIPITILVPAYNESVTIANSLRSLLQLDYPEYEIIVINDGSKDDTLSVLMKEFSLIPYPEATQEKLKSAPVKKIYRSTRYPKLRVIDKENGGKADSLNAGINSSRYPVFCCIDSDSMLQRDSLKQIVQPFLEDPTTIAAGGTVRIANGCTIENGFFARVGLPRNYLALMQIVEYLRAFLFGRMGWTPMNAVLIISGAFGLFRKDTVVEVGGYRTDTVGEDMEIVIRLHRHMRLSGRPYRICFVPNPICWTEAPESLKVLKSQRVRWQRGLCEALWMNKKLLFHPKGGTASWLAYPFMILFEALEPLIQVSGYLVTLILFLTGDISVEATLTFMMIVIGLGMILSMNALVLEEISFHVYPGFKKSFTLFASSFLENFGYRQLNTYWRVIGTFKWIFHTKAKWGQMTRSGIGISLKSFLLLISVFGILLTSKIAIASSRQELMTKARAAAVKKDFEVSEKIYRKLVEKNPLDIDAATGLAFVMAWSGRYAEAETLFVDIHKKNPNNRDALMGLANIYFWQERREDSLREIDLLLKSYPNDADALALKEKIKQQPPTENPNKWSLRAGYEFQAISFTSDAHGMIFSGMYERKKKWSLLASYRNLRKFGELANEGGYGAGWWATPNTHFLMENTFSPSQSIIPTQSYSLQVEQVLFKVWVPFVKYRFADYSIVNVHDIHMGLTWYFVPEWGIQGRYVQSISQFANRTKRDHSASFKLFWNPTDKINAFAGYARTSESFDSGNPINPTGTFSAHHFFGGFKWEFYKGLGIDASIEREDRSTDDGVTTFNVGLNYAW